MKNLTTLLAALLMLTTAPAQAEEVVLETATGPLAGSFLIPGGEGPWPAVFILAGSGPTDRDGNSTMFPGRNNSLKQLAEALAAEGIASLRVDKRGVAGSAGAALAEQDLTFDVFIDDATDWCALLRSDARFSSVTVAGHSQGAQVGAAAAWRVDADGYVSIAGPGRSIITILREQLADRLPVRSRVQADAVLDELALGRTVEEVPAGLDMVLRPSIQPFLISWDRRDPRLDLARLPLPVLVLQGTDDIQISVEDAENLTSARPGATLVLVEGMNHIMKNVPRENTLGQQMSLVDSTLVIMPEAIAAVATLVQEADAGAARRAEARQRVHGMSEGAERILPPGVEDERLAAEQGRPTPERVGAWARRFLAAEDVTYLFGLAEGGYVDEGQVVSDRRQDCVSLLYRVSELARARDHQDAVDWALRTRFAGAGLDSVVGSDGRVDYDAPAHLDYSLDMIRTGLWGRDVTTGFAGATLDTVGTPRYEAGSFSYVLTAGLDPGELQEGDVVWFVLNPEHEGAAKLRDEHGLVIGHIGVVIVEEGAPWLVHAARSDLEGWYDGGTVVKVPLADYLARVDRFAGIIVTRF